MHTIKQMNSLPSDQQGASLLVALILLVLISLIGVGTLKSASVVEKMSSSDYQKNVTFQASESAAALTLQDPQNISDVLISKATKEIDVDTDITNTEADVKYAYVGFGHINGASMGAGGFTGQRIIVTSIGRIKGNDKASTTRTVHGMVQLTPSM